MGEARSAISDQKGKARIRLAPQTRENSWVSLQILKSPPGTNLIMVSPWEYKDRIPSFVDEAKNFVRVVVVQRGERAALENGLVMKALASQINKANAPKTADNQSALSDPKANLEAVARQHGYTSDELDKAIRAWGVTVTDPYDVGVAALYERSYEKATANLKESLRQREQKLATARKDVADAAFFLGQSLYEQGQYKESAVAYQHCLQLRPDDPTALNNTGVSLMKAGDYASAEPLYRRAVEITEKTLGLDHPDVAMSLNNLAELLRKKATTRGPSRCSGRLWRSREGAGTGSPRCSEEPQQPRRAASERRGLRGSRAAYRRALAINEAALGPNHPEVATNLNNLAGLLREERDYAGAEPLYRRSLAIREAALGPNHPDVANSLNNLAGLL